MLTAMKFKALTLSVLLSAGSLWGCYPKSSAAEHQDVPPSLIQAQNQLGFELFHSLYQADKNLFLSPTSIFLALAMLYSGAEGQTREEMRRVLHLDKVSDNEVQQAAQAWMQNLNREQQGLVLEIANAIWLRQGFELKTDYRDLLSDHFQAEAHSAPFNAATLKDINAWASDKTHGKIPKILEGLEADLVAVLLNAIYFKGQWKKEFNPESTRPADFHLGADQASEKVQVEMMRQDGKFDYAEDEDWQLLRLPYGEQEAADMWIMLPKIESSLSAQYAEIGPENWQAWREQLSSREGTVLLPKFKIEYQRELSPQLSALGMPSAFGQANFKRISEADLQVSQVIHKSFVEVNEQGTEAAAVTAVGLRTTSVDLSRFVFNANRPFAFAIVERQQGSILFLGALQRPE